LEEENSEEQDDGLGGSGTPMVSVHSLRGGSGGDDDQ